jgi:hypothetical protein
MRFLILSVALFFFQCENKITPQISNLENTTISNSNKKMSNNSENIFPIEIDSTISVKIEKDYIEVDYTLKNTGGKSYLVFNQGDTDKGLGASKMYAEYLGDGIIELSQKRFFEPQDKKCPNYEIAVQAGAKWLKPNETIKQNLKISRPLKTFTPFDACEPQTIIPTEAKKIKFCLGIAEADSAKVIVGKQGDIEDWSGVGKQTVICSEIKDLE